MNNIPIYRAKKIDSDEWIEGYLLRYSNGYFIKLTNEAKEIKIYPSTLAIHFRNMIDENGKCIFASLNDDGIGGDSFGLEDDYWWLKFDGDAFRMMDSDDYEDQHEFIQWKYLEVIGIYKGELDEL